MTDLIKYDMTDIWASSGDIVAPDSAKIASGWGVEVVPRQWWNWFENRQDQNIAYILQKGFPEWDITTEYIINKSYVQRNGTVYKALLTGTNKDPQTEPTYWVKVFADYSTASNALGSVTPATDTMPYFTSASTATVTSLTAFMRTLLDDGDAATARATLDAQQANSNLTALSSVTANTNLLPYFTSSSAMGTTTLTAFARTLLDDSDAATMRSTLGLSTGATSTVTTSAYDTTAGRLLKVGDFGLGTTDLIDNASDLNTINVSGMYMVTGANQPAGWGSGMLLVMPNAGLNVAQIYVVQGSNRMYFRTSSGSLSSWSAWSEVQSTTNGASTAEAQAGTDDTKWLSPLKSLQQLKKYGVGSLNNSADSNVTVLQPALGALPTGIYSFNAGTTNAPTPSNSGIVLHFERSGDSGVASGAYQMVLNGDGSTYTSQRNNITGVWSTWSAFSSAVNSVQKIGDTMTGPLKFAAGTGAGLVSNTSDGADNGVVSLGGGGSSLTARGAVVNLFGNEHSTNPGQLNLYAGDNRSINMTSTGGYLTLSGTGQVTIGQAASGDSLTVTGTSKFNGSLVTTASLIGTAGGGVSVLNDTSTKLTNLYGGTNADSGGFVQAYGVSHPSRPGELALGGTFATTTNSTIRFFTQTQQRGIWLSNGRLLIGTGSDNGSGLLQVNGTITASDSLSVGGTVAAAGGFTSMYANTIQVRSNDPSNGGNVHLWFYNYNGTERGLIYWSNDGSCHFRTGGSGEMMNVGPQGNLTTSGTITGPTVVSNSQVWAGGGSGRLHPDGNVQGSIWGGSGAYLSTYLANTFVQYGNLQAQRVNNDTAGAIGSYAFLYNNTSVNVTPGNNASGADLIWSDTAEGNGGVVGFGTWRSMGLGWNHNASLWLRIS